MKAEGKDIKGHPVIDQILKVRTILEKNEAFGSKTQVSDRQIAEGCSSW